MEEFFSNFNLDDFNKESAEGFVRITEFEGDFSDLIKGVEDEFYIRVGIGEEGLDHYRKFCRISLTEPKYIYNSEKLPEEGRDAIIKAIIKSYKLGIESINHDMNKIMFDPNRPIPDYTKL